MAEEKVRKRERKSKGPLGGFQPKLAWMKKLVPAGKVGRIVNDTENRVQMFLDNDYEFVYTKRAQGDKKNTDLGTKVSTVVGTSKTNEPMRGFLMVIDKDWYEEDQGKKQERVDNVDRAIRTPGFGANQKGLDSNHTYGKIDYKA